MQLSHPTPISVISCAAQGSRGDQEGKGHHPPSTYAVFLAPVSTGGVGERTKICRSVTLAGRAGDFPTVSVVSKRNGFVCSGLVQSWSKVVKNQAPLILCSTGALF